MAAWDDRVAEAVVRKEQGWSKSDKQELDDAVKAMLTHRATRRYLYWLLEIGKAIGQNPFTTNALTTSFQCGEQNVGQQVMAHLIEVAPDGFLDLLKETKNERDTRSGELSRLRDSTGAADA